MTAVKSVRRASSNSARRGSRSSSGWLLVGRRHSVDDRRDDVDHTKALLMHSISTEIDEPWRERTSASTAEITALEGRLRTEITRQKELIQAARDYWVERSSADRNYLP